MLKTAKRKKSYFFLTISLYSATISGIFGLYFMWVLNHPRNAMLSECLFNFHLSLAFSFAIGILYALTEAIARFFRLTSFVDLFYLICLLFVCLIPICFYFDSNLYQHLGTRLSPQIVWHKNEIKNILPLVWGKVSQSPDTYVLLIGVPVLLSVAFTFFIKEIPRFAQNPMSRGEMCITSLLFLLFLFATNFSFPLFSIRKWIYISPPESPYNHSKLTQTDISLAKALLGFSSWTNPAYPLLHQKHINPLPYDGVFKNYNLIVVVLEAFRAVDVGAYGSSLKMTPYFDAWAKKGLLVEPFYASGVQTGRSLYSIICSVPARWGTMRMEEHEKHSALTLGQLLKKNGYHYGFYSGGEADQDRARSFFIDDGADEIMSSQHIMGIPRTNPWGFNDKEMFDQAIKKIKKRPEPFAAVILTLSGHQPFEFGVWPKGATGWNSRFRGDMKYADEAFGQFLTAVEKLPFFKNTLFVITADTGSDFSTKGNTTHSSLSEVSLRVPLLIFSGDGKIKPQRLKVLSSHVDILPTLANMLGISPLENPWWGHSIFEDIPNRFYYTNTPWGKKIFLRYKNIKMVIETVSNTIHQYRITGFDTTKIEGQPTFMQERLLTAVHRFSQNLIENKKIYPTRQREQPIIETIGVKRKDKTSLWAHRGFHAQGLRENSLMAVQYSKKMGYKGVEIDAHIKSDHTFRITHDHFPQDEAHKYPTLDQMLKYVGNNFPIWVDFKNLDDNNVKAAAKRLSELIEKHQVKGPIYVESGHYRLIAELEEKDPKIRAMATVSGKVDFKLKRIKGYGISCIAIPYGLISPEIIQKTRGLKIFAYTVNTSEAWEYLNQLGVDVVLTDQLVYDDRIVD